jgi:hypothetical protein
MTSGRSNELRDLAQRVVDALPPAVVEEAVLTGSVSLGVADELSDIELLLVTPDQLELATCFAYARAAGLAELDTWGSSASRRAPRRSPPSPSGSPSESRRRCPNRIHGAPCSS